MKAHDYQGNTFWYKEAGEGDPMVFLHNGGNDHSIWEHQAKFFKKSYRVFRVDLPGYGRSEKAKIDYRLPFYTEALNDFLKKRVTKPAVLVGNCMGSAISLEIAQKNPDLVRSLVLFNVLTEATLFAGTYGLFSRINGLPGLKSFLGWFGGWFTPPRFVAAFSLKDQFGPVYQPDDAFLSHLVDLYRVPGQLRVLNSLVADTAPFRKLNQFEKPTDFVPSFVLWGEKNKVLPWKAGKDFIKAFGPDRVLTLENGGHLCMVEYADLVNHEIQAFLDGIKPTI